MWGHGEGCAEPPRGSPSRGGGWAAPLALAPCVRRWPAGATLKPCASVRSHLGAHKVPLKRGGGRKLQLPHPGAGMSEPACAQRDSCPAATSCLHPGQEVAVWRPLMTTTASTASAAFTAPPLAPRAAVAPPPPPPAVPFQGVSTSHSTYVAHAIERPHIPQPPPRQVLPFHGSSTAHTDFPPHAIPRRRPSLGIASTGDRAPGAARRPAAAGRGRRAADHGARGAAGHAAAGVSGRRAGGQPQPPAGSAGGGRPQGGAAQGRGAAAGAWRPGKAIWHGYTAPSLPGVDTLGHVAMEALLQGASIVHCQGQAVERVVQLRVMLPAALLPCLQVKFSLDAGGGELLVEAGGPDVAEPLSWRVQMPPC